MAGAERLQPVAVLQPDVVGEHAVVLTQPGVARRERVVGRDVAIVRPDDLGQRRQWPARPARAGVRGEEDGEDQARGQLACTRGHGVPSFPGRPS